MLIFIYGQDNFRGKQKVKELKDKFLQEVDNTGSSLTYIDGKDTNIKDINNKVGASSLFSRKRMVVIENIFSNSSKETLEDLFDYFKNQEKTSNNIILFFSPEVKKIKKKKTFKTVLIDSQDEEKPLTKKASLLFNFLDKQKYTQEYPPLSDSELIEWITQNVWDKGGKITYQAARALVGLVSNNLWQLSNEINKLVHHQKSIDKKSAPTIDIKEVQELVKANFDEDIFALTDALANKDKKKALRVLEEQYEAGSSDVYLLSMSIWQFKILLKIRQALDNGDTPYKIPSNLGLHPFVVQKNINYVRKFNLDELKYFFNKLIEADYQMKTGKQDVKLMLDMLIVSFKL